MGDQSLAYFATWCPARITIEKLVVVEGSRWAIEENFEYTKTELGLDHNETRSWHGWQRRVSLVMLAFAMMARVRHHANAVAPPRTLPRLPRTRRTSSAGPSGRYAASPPALSGEASSLPT